MTHFVWRGLMTRHIAAQSRRIAMGYSAASAIEGAGKYLLDRLLAATKLPYSTFFDGTDATHDQLTKSVGLEDDGWYSPEHLVDLAVYELEEQGIIETEELTTALEDGEHDYLIQLTEEGRKKLACGYQPKYWDAE
jgi:hypothetical protein